MTERSDAFASFKRAYLSDWRRARAEEDRLYALGYYLFGGAWQSEPGETELLRLFEEQQRAIRERAEYHDRKRAAKAEAKRAANAKRYAEKKAKRITIFA